MKCFIQTNQLKINNFLKNNCGGNCKDTIRLDTNADILLTAITVLNYLINKGEFDRASQILNSLDVCGSLCSEFNDDLNGCGCGTT